MTGTTSQVEHIVNHYCRKFLTEIKSYNEFNAVGIAVALYYPNNPDVPAFFHYGLSAPDQGVTRDTIYSLGSVTKVFTSTLASYLTVTGVIPALDQALAGPYLSNASCRPSVVSGAYWENATFFQFGTQTSGMPDKSEGYYADQLFSNALPSCDQLNWWNDPKRQATWTEKQKFWIYSNAGFITLGFAVAGAAQKNNGYTGGYPGLLSEVITGQIGMPNTFVGEYAPATGAPMATGYNPKQAVAITGAADMKSTAQDMYAWLAAVHQAMVVQGTNYWTMTPLELAIAGPTTIAIPYPINQEGNPCGFAMGLGWQIPTFNGVTYLEKDGGTQESGCSCWVGLTRYQEGGPIVGIAILTNQCYGKYAPSFTGRKILEELINFG